MPYLQRLKYIFMKNTSLLNEIKRDTLLYISSMVVQHWLILNRDGPKKKKYNIHISSWESRQKKHTFFWGSYINSKNIIPFHKKYQHNFTVIKSCSTDGNFDTRTEVIKQCVDFMAVKLWRSEVEFSMDIYWCINTGF